VRVEEYIARWIRDWLYISLPLFNLLLRLFLNIVSDNRIGMMRRIFALPEDLMFVSLSLLFAGMAGIIPSYSAHYRAHGISPILAGAVLAFIGVLITFAVHRWDTRVVQPRFQDVYVAAGELATRARAAAATGDGPPAGTTEYGFKLSGDFIFGSFLWLLELATATYCLSYISKVITGQ
jgi:hypothetical protein